jgi:Tfp pilus assembly protein PilF
MAVAKTPAMIAADQAFIQTIEKQGYTHASGSDAAVQLGWKYFRNHDLPTAMKRFNQAWLLDQSNGDAFEGFAVVTLERDGDAASADRYFARALASARQSSGVYVDYGRFLLMQKRPKEALPLLEKARAVPGASPDTNALLALALFQTGDAARACGVAATVPDAVQAELRDAARAILKSGRCNA